MHAYICTRCRDWREALRTPARCVACGTLGTMRRHVPDEAEAASASGRDLADIAHDAPRRIGSGWAHVDAALGGGWVRGEGYVLGGGRGLGKTRFLLQAMQNATGARAVLLTCEQTRPQVRHVAEGCIGAEIRRGISVVVVRTLDDALRELDRVAHDPDGLDIAAVDSIAALQLAGDPRDRPHNYDNVSYCAFRLRRWLERHTETVLIATNHLNKKGEGAGQAHIYHELTTELEFDGMSGPGPRVLRTKKDRYGPGGQSAWFAMVEPGRLEPADAPAPPAPRAA